MQVGGAFVTRKKVTVLLEFFDNQIGQQAAFAFQPFMKLGTKVISPLQFESFVYPPNAAQFVEYLNEKYQATMDIWDDMGTVE